MACKVLFTEDALNDLEVLLDYIAVDNPNAAERFGTALLKHIELLETLPWIGMPVPGRTGIRKILHSPERIYYRVHKDRRLVEILHLWHGSRREPII